MEFFTIGCVAIGVSLVGSILAGASFHYGHRRGFHRGLDVQQVRVRQALRGRVRPQYYVPGAMDDRCELNACAVQVNELGEFRYVLTGDPELVAESLRAAAEIISPLQF